MTIWFTIVECVCNEEVVCGAYSVMSDRVALPVSCLKLVAEASVDLEEVEVNPG